MTSRAIFKAKDHDKEGTRFGVYLATITSANLDATVAAIAGLQTAINAIVLGTYDGLDVKVSELKASSVPVDPFAQRESKWRVEFTDNVDPMGDGSFEIGMPDLTKLNPNSADADLTDVDIAAFVTALQATCVSRLGNGINVTSITHVGRNI